MSKDKFLNMRASDWEKQGIIDMIEWINGYRPTNEMRMIEIGSYIGESTTIFAKHFKEVVSVDPYIDGYDLNDAACTFAPFDKVYGEFLKNTLHIPNIKSIRETSDKAVEILKGQQWDFVYIDGIHTFEGVSADINNYMPLISNGGFISGHDYNWGNVRHAIGQLLNDNVDSVFVDSSWIKRII